MGLAQILFYIFGIITLGSAIAILFTKNIIYAAYLLVLIFLCVAALYVIAGAEFVAVTQIIIYAGGILVLLIFGIMLTNRLAGQKVHTGSGNVVMGMVLGILFFGLLIGGIHSAGFDKIQGSGPASDLPYAPVRDIAIQLMTDFILIFELAGILILIAMIGAAFMAKKDFERNLHGID
jgi:NADH-quinone oxidoreductase subunit J